MNFEYFYGRECEQFTFFRIPKVLFVDKRFKDMSTDAKVLYGLMLDRMGLSLRNGWLDDKNRAYIIYKVEDIMYFYSDGNYNFCKTNNKEYRVKNKLYEIDKVSNDFVRISKGCIINIKQVKSFDIGENRNIIIKFNDDYEQYVARRKIKEVMNYLDERMI